jgi:hypothetical protein
MDIENAGKVVCDFFARVLSKDARIVKLSRSDDGWAGEVEVYEDSSFIKSLGLPTRVKDRNIYEFSLSNDLEVTAYSLKGES